MYRRLYIYIYICMYICIHIYIYIYICIYLFTWSPLKQTNIVKHILVSCLAFAIYFVSVLVSKSLHPHMIGEHWTPYRIYSGKGNRYYPVLRPRRLHIALPIALYCLYCIHVFASQQLRLYCARCLYSFARTLSTYLPDCIAKSWSGPSSYCCEQRKRPSRSPEGSPKGSAQARGRGDVLRIVCASSHHGNS